MIEEALRRCVEGYRPDGRPAKGKLLSLELNATPFGWQAIAKFWLVEEWNVATGLDPVACLNEVLTSSVPDGDFSDLLV